MDRIAKGSIEYYPIRVTDSLGNLENLSGSNPKFDLRLRDSDEWELENEDVTINVMTCLCLIDTTSLDVGIYEIFLHFDNIPEHPRLGPFPVDVS